MDVQIIQALVDASNKIQRSLFRTGVNCYPVVFLRSDIWELLVRTTADSDKISRVSVDWTDREALRQMLRRRLEFAGLSKDDTFDAMWLRVCCSQIKGKSSIDYVMDGCLMRPRALLGQIAAGRNRAINRGHHRVEEEDVIDGCRDYSQDLLRDVMQEIRDVAPEIEDGLYALIDTPASLSKRIIYQFFKNWKIRHSQWDYLIEQLLWYAVLGVEASEGQVRYIYDLNYDFEMLKAIVRRMRGSCTYWLNPAFRPALAVSEPQGPHQERLL